MKYLLNNYKMWSTPDICNKFEVIYYDKLIKFRKNDILDVSSAIGYKHDNTVDKKKLCNEIIAHYSRRVKLLQDVEQVLDRGRDRIIRSKRGAICRNVTKDLPTFTQCRSIPDALWLNEEQYQNMIHNMKKTPRFKEWKHWLNRFEDEYFSCLKKIFRCVNDIKNDIDNVMDDIEFDKLELYTRELIDKLDVMTEVYYLLIINFA
jgi:hypothetical protein